MFYFIVLKDIVNFLVSKKLFCVNLICFLYPIVTFTPGEKKFFLQTFTNNQ